ncbi:hypothetical protein BV372_25525 [Nostoc sp. T09]|nr:hypothetical protein BV372_25525 [Nostoc sp. T09]
MALAAIGTAAGVFGAIFAYAQITAWTPELPGFSSKDRFSCALQPDTQNGGEVWTVMYRNDQTKKPWLKMVNNFGDEWNTQKRCDAIAQRLEGFRQDGLIGFSHRTDPKTLNQSVICAVTRLDRSTCNLLVTLKPGVDGYESLRRMIEAKKNGTTVDQGSNDSNTVSMSATRPKFISFEDQLATEDTKAGVSANK